MYYSNGNYEAFARPRKPRGVDQKTAHFVGAGIASLAGAAFLVRDGQMDGRRITIYEASSLAGGALDAIRNPERGYLMRGERELENHYECMWDLLRSIPSLEVENASVLDEYYWLNKDEPNYSLRRTTENRGQPHATDGKLTLTPEALREVLRLAITPEKDLYGKAITDVLGEDFLRSNFWVYWKTTFAFEPWQSALEMKRYLNRFVHLLGGMADLSAITFSRHNQYESFVLPLVTWLEKQGVTIQYDTRVTNVAFDIEPQRKVARRIEWIHCGKQGGRDLAETDLVFVTNGSCVENATWGDHHTPPSFNPEVHEGGSWALWRNIAAQDPVFGRPDAFCTHVDQSTWESATLTTLDDEVPRYVQKITQRDPFAFGGTVDTGGLVTIRDSGWQMSWSGQRQPNFKDQPHSQLVFYLQGLYVDQPGNYVKKPMRDCTGEEIAREWLYHLGVPLDDIDGLAAKSVNCNPCLMPFINAFFLPRHAGDRPDVVPRNVVNCAFIGQFSETPRDCIFTIEYSVRTAMEAVYTLLSLERGVPEAWGSQYDVRALLNAASLLRDGQKLGVPDRIGVTLDGRQLELTGRQLVQSDVGELLREYGLIGELEKDLLTVAVRKEPPRAMPVL